MDIKAVVDSEHAKLEKWLLNQGYNYTEDIRSKLDKRVYSDLLEYYITFAPKELALQLRSSTNPIPDTLLTIKKAVELNKQNTDLVQRNTYLIVRKIFGEYRYSLIYG